MHRFDSNNPSFNKDFAAFMAKPRGAAHDVSATVKTILADVQQSGDNALSRYTAQFDHLERESLRLSAAEITAIASRCPSAVRHALEVAHARITAFHQQQQPPAVAYTDALGVAMGLHWNPVDAAGLYVPGGRASYPSSVLMNAVPAKVAGVKRLAMVVPLPHGEANPAVFTAAMLAGIDEIYAVGGAQAIAALAFGTATIKAVDVIVGPGNAYVAEAKRQVYGRVGIDSIAGPSEVCVVADASTPPLWTAWDLLAQAEHDPDAQSILLTDDAAYADAVATCIPECLQQLPANRQQCAAASWRDYGAIIVTSSRADIPALINHIAPEHLMLCCDDAAILVANVRHAGSIFIGRYTSEAVGDYLGGPNHVLPTMGSARFASGLSVYDFMKRTTTLSCPASALQQLGTEVAILAEAEGLLAHQRSVTIRLESLS